MGRVAWRRAALPAGCAGRLGWLARYLKEVDSNKTTLRFWQEVYDDTGKLVEIHEELPVDKDHGKV